MQVIMEKGKANQVMLWLLLIQSSQVRLVWAIKSVKNCFLELPEKKNQQLQNLLLIYEIFIN